MSDATDRRRVRRIQFKEAVQFQQKDSTFLGGSPAMDLSEGGLGVQFNDFVRLHTEFMLQFQLLNENAVECMGRVVWIRKLPFNDRYEAGIEFIGEESTHISKKKIHQFLQPLHQ